MNVETSTPSGSLSDLFAGTGTAPAREVENMELGESIPRAVNPTDIDRRATRWLAFVGDLATPKMKRERPDFVIGGEYFGQQFATLVRTKGLVRRCQLTPMEIAHDFIPDEILGANETGMVVVDRVISGGAPGEHATGSKSLNLVQVFPGDEIRGILHREHNATSGAKGFVEIETLRGIEVADVQAAGIQEFLFPNWAKILRGLEPIENKISGIRTHLEGRKRETGDQKYHQIIEAYLEACDRYSRWGLDYLKVSAQLVRLPINGGFAHTYSEQAEMLFEQLEVTREDAVRLANSTPMQGASGSPNDVDVNSLLHKMVEIQQQLANAQMGAAAPAKEEAAATPIVPFAEPQPSHTDEEPIAAKAENANQCTAVTGAGAQCSQDAVEGTDRCAHPAHRR